MYLIKANRSYTNSNHQYIIGFANDEDIAHFVGEYHCKFERGGHKYMYTIENIPWVEDKCFVVSWENNDESLRYRIYGHKTFSKVPEGANKNYRFKTETCESIEDFDEEDLEDAADHWHYFKGKELLGLSKLYEKYKERQREKYLKELK